MKRRLLVLLELLAAVALAQAAEAEGLQSHSVTYDVKPLKEAKDVYLEGQPTFTLTKKCDGWTLGEILQLGTEKGPTAG